MSPSLRHILRPRMWQRFDSAELCAIVALLADILRERNRQMGLWEEL